MPEFCDNNRWLPLKFSVENYNKYGEHLHYGSVICNLKDIEMDENKIFYLKNEKGEKKGNFIKFD